MSDSDQQQAEKQDTSTLPLPFDPADLTRGIRVRPAQFARMCNVSRQAVSMWIKKGKITLYTDGTLDPAKAAQSVVKNTDPSRLRAKVFRASNDEIADLRKNTTTLAKELTAAKAQIEYLERGRNEADRAEQNFLDLLGLARITLFAADDKTYSAILVELNDLSWLIAGGYESLPGDAGEVDEYLANIPCAPKQTEEEGEVEIMLPTADELANLYALGSLDDAEIDND